MSGWESLRTSWPPVSDGDRSWRPFEVRSEIEAAIASLPDPTSALASEITIATDPQWRLTLLVLLALQDDPRVDQILRERLSEERDRAPAAYLIGVIGTRGWPRRTRDVPSLVRPLQALFDDESEWNDPVHGEALAVCDIALAAVVRMVGPDRFPWLAAIDDDRPETSKLIGLELARFTPEQRSALKRTVTQELATLGEG